MTSRMDPERKRSIREDIYAASLEFCGTVLFLLLGLGGVQSAITSTAGADSATVGIQRLIYQSASLGLALLVSVWLFYRVTGGLFNPNVSLALLLIGAISPLRFVMCATSQMVGAIVAAGLLQALMPGPLEVNTVPAPNITKAQALFVEMFVTAALVFSVLMLAAEKHRVRAFAPIGIGLTLFAAELWALPLTGGSLNTARSFGPAVVTSFDSSHWVYWLGPFMGTILATGFYLGLKQLGYERLNPGQDGEAADHGEGVQALSLNTRTANVNGKRMKVGFLPINQSHLGSGDQLTVVFSTGPSGPEKV